MTEQMDAVGRTALITAAMRAVEYRRADRLHNDQYAELLSGELGPALLEELTGDMTGVQKQRLLSVFDLNAVRTRFFDDCLLREARTVTQIVSLASGLDTRPYRLDWPGHVRYFEVDRPAVMAYKADRLGEVPARAEHRMIAADLTDEDWAEQLIAADYDPGLPSVWLMEGLLYYLPEPDAHWLVSRVRALSAPGSVLTADIASAAAVAGQIGAFTRWGCPWVFGTDEPEAFLDGHGFTPDEAVVPGQRSTAYGRSAPAGRGAAASGRPVYLVRGKRR
ncbi:class I SAM-dependent methyltransferase [Streptomyces sp. NPDC050418]|uniref:class I SAM-dependent methyltransferase n=1 Tax=Streptomyces sp. NPDC050418 TaxID=3365612 RepID=UPI0037B1C2A8